MKRSGGDLDREYLLLILYLSRAVLSLLQQCSMLRQVSSLLLHHEFCIVFKADSSLDACVTDLLRNAYCWCEQGQEEYSN